MEGVVEVQVNRELCEANARCVTLAPEMFALDDDDVLHISTAAAIEPARVELAVASCPLAALSVRTADRADRADRHRADS
jgi:ferredoxin